MLPLLASAATFLENNWKTIVAIISGLVLLVFVYSWDKRGKELIVQQDRQAILQADIQTLKTEKDMLTRANQIVNDELRKQQEVNNSVNQIHSKIDALPASTACKLDPAISAAIDGIRGLHKSTASR